MIIDDLVIKYVEVRVFPVMNARILMTGLRRSNLALE
jgi:hypothetical protein